MKMEKNKKEEKELKQMLEDLQEKFETETPSSGDQFEDWALDTSKALKDTLVDCLYKYKFTKNPPFAMVVTFPAITLLCAEIDYLVRVGEVEPDFVNRLSMLMPRLYNDFKSKNHDEND